MTDLRKKISTTLDVYIPEGKWNTLADKIAPSGEPTKYRMNKIIFLLCEEIEGLSTKIDDLTFQLEKKRGK